MAKGKGGAQQQQQQKEKGGKQDRSAGNREADGVQHYSSYIQVLATDIDHNSPSLLLFTDKEGRMLFNAGEGLQRMFRENKLKMQKLETYLFTRVSTETMSGLPGMLLSSGAGMAGTAAGSAGDAGGLLAPPVTCSLYGPSGLQQFVTAFRPYVNQEQELRVQEVRPAQEAIKTRFFTITPLTISPVQGQQPQGHGAAGNGAAAAKQDTAKEEVKVKADAGADAGGIEEPSAKRVKLEDGGAAASAQGSGEGVKGEHASSSAQHHHHQQQPAIHWPGTGDDAVVQREAVAYMCEFATVPGKFDPKKAEALGVQKGPDFGKLQRGQSVTAADGSTVQPHQVMDPPNQPGPVVMVVDVPSEAHLAALEGARGRELLQRWLPCEPSTSGGSAAVSRLTVMAHLTNARIAASGRYRTWIESLGSGVSHLLCSLQPGDTQVVTLKRATTLQAKLNSIHPTLFPLLKCTSPPVPPSDLQEHHWQAVDGAEAAAAAASGAQQPLPQLVAGRSGLKLHLTPIKAQGLDGAEVGPQGVDVAAAKEELAKEGQEVLAAAAAMRAAPEPGDKVPPALEGIGRDVAQLVFLGTASSQPSKYRNVTSLYLDCLHRGGMLLDCGEDALGQLKRTYGVAGAEARVLGLKCVWVSHMHADHHGGLYRLLELRARLMGRDATPLLVIGPWPLFNVLTGYQPVVPLPFHFLSNAHLLPGNSGHRQPPPAVLESFKQAQAALGIRLQPFTVHHIAHAFGLKISGAEGRDWSIVFSGDTRPCRNTVDAARGASLLVHEATFEDEMVEDAVRKKHSTTGDALGVAAESGVYRVILTHFSTRYPTLPQMDLSAHPHVACATDFMTVNLADLAWLPRVMPPLAALFTEEKAAWEQDEVPGGAGGPVDAAMTPA